MVVVCVEHSCAGIYTECFACIVTFPTRISILVPLWVTIGNAIGCSVVGLGPSLAT